MSEWFPWANLNNKESNSFNKLNIYMFMLNVETYN